MSKFELKGNTVTFNGEECVPALLVNVVNDKSIVVASDTYYNFNKMSEGELHALIGVVCLPEVYHIVPLTGDVNEETICKLNSCYRLTKESESINDFFFGDESDFNIDYPDDVYLDEEDFDDTESDDIDGLADDSYEDDCDYE